MLYVEHARFTTVAALCLSAVYAVWAVLFDPSRHSMVVGFGLVVAVPFFLLLWKVISDNPRES